MYTCIVEVGTLIEKQTEVCKLWVLGGICHWAELLGSDACVLHRALAVGSDGAQLPAPGTQGASIPVEGCVLGSLSLL